MKPACYRPSDQDSVSVALIAMTRRYTDTTIPPLDASKPVPSSTCVGSYDELRTYSSRAANSCTSDLPTPRHHELHLRVSPTAQNCRMEGPRGSIHGTHATGGLAGTVQDTLGLSSDAPCQDDTPVRHPRALPVRPGCRMAGRYGLIHGIPSNWLSRWDPPRRPMPVIRCVTIVGPFSTLPGPSFTPEHVASAPKVPHGRFLKDLTIAFQPWPSHGNASSYGSLSPTSYTAGLVQRIVKTSLYVSDHCEVAQGAG